MADSDQTLKLLVQFGVVNAADVKAAQDLIVETGKAAGKAGEAHGEMGKGIEKAGEAAEHANHHHDISRHLFSEINRIAPGLGESLHAAFSGPLGAILLVGIAIHEVQEKLKEYNEELDKQAEDAYAPHLTALAALQKAWDDAATHMAEYNAKLEHAGEDKDPIGTQIKRLKELEKAQTESDKKIIESQARLEEQAIRTRNALLGISNEQTEVDVARVKLRAQRAIASADDAGHAGDINALKLEQTDAQKNSPEDQAALAAAKAAARFADSQFNRDEDERKRLKDEGYGRALTEDEMAKLKKDHPTDERVQADTARQKLEQMKADYEKEKELAKYAVNPAAQLQFADSHFAPKIAAAQAEYDRHEKQVDGMTQQLKRLDDSFDARTQALAEAKETLTKAGAQYQLDVARLKELPAEIAQAMAVEAERQRGEHAAENNAGRESVLKNLPPNLVGAVAGADAAYFSGQQLNNSQVQAVAQLKSFLDAAHVNSQQILALIADGVRKNETLAQILAQIQRQLAAGNSNFGR